MCYREIAQAKEEIICVLFIPRWKFGDCIAMFLVVEKFILGKLMSVGNSNSNCISKKQQRCLDYLNIIELL